MPFCETNPPGGGFGPVGDVYYPERGTASGPLALQIGQSRAARPADESVFAKASTRQGGPRNMWLSQTTAASRRTRLRRDRETLEICSSGTRTGLEIDGFYVEQTKRQGVRMRERKIPIRFVWDGIESR